ncbi:polysaccharide pyruvyl transferase family protein [Paenibacillus vini]|uniref:polysaccharide pyruvyl transferase family protein n=1 Tax=Paenibacillus vini TaxID=1476024 RepID=UPI0025B6B674|nr:polysaccharide pyruvyl transferase family protein [Paenibacillus vini]MDN4066453.1 polysaccharide pyruvyl transferase family protein [Paenibacillus vini]
MIIYHVGAWAGNFGDSILQQSIYNNLTSISKVNLEFRYINCQTTEFTKELIEEINTSGDMLLVGGGGLIFYRPQDNSVSGWQWNIHYELIDLLDVPLVVYGIGYNQFEFDHTNFIEITNKHLQKTVEKAALFSVRNQGTKEELIARGCDGTKVRVIPDSGMFLESKPIQIPGLNSQKVKIGFNWTTDRENQTFPAPYEESKEAFLKACIQSLNKIITDYNAQVVYIGHMSEEFDASIIKYLEENLIEAPVIIDRVLSDIYPPAGERASFLVDIYRQMDVVLGMRGHANIVSFGQKTPFIGLGSHRKIRYFLEDINRSSFFFDVRPNSEPYSVESMYQKIKDCIEHKEEHINALNEELKKQNNIFDSFNKEIIEVLCK